MNDVVHKSSGPKKKRKRGGPAKPAMTLGMLLVLLLYFLMLEQYGLPFLDLNGDEPVDEVSP
jgi:hypothetical protein